MPKVPSIKPKDVIRAFLKAGFQIKRQKGSHVYLEKVDFDSFICIPMHNKDIKKGLFLAQIKQAGFTFEEFKKYI